MDNLKNHKVCHQIIFCKSSNLWNDYFGPLETRLCTQLVRQKLPFGHAIIKTECNRLNEKIVLKYFSILMVKSLQRFYRLRLYKSNN
jgi:hypothetical protein